MRIRSWERRGRSFRLFMGPNAQQAVREELGATARFARWPHHTCSAQALLGGVTWQRDSTHYRIQLGELMLASHRTLVLQDLPEFRREVIERLGTAWSQQESCIALPETQPPRWLAYPVHCCVIATAENCPCGMLGTTRKCSCTTAMLSRWQNRIDAAVKAFTGEAVAWT